MIEHAVRVIGSHMLQSVVNQWWRRRQHKPRNGLPLLLTTTPPDSLEDTVGVERVLDILGDASAQVLEHLHEVNKHLQFWQIRAQGTERDKVRFMVLERGPWAFLQGVRQLLRSLVWDSSTQGLVVAAAIRITERVSMLTDLRNRLAVLNGQLYMEVAKMGEKMNAGQRSRRAIAECVVAVLEAMAVLEGAYDLPQADESASSTRPFILEFEGMSEELMRGMDWTNNELHNALELLSRNLQTLKEFLAGLMSYYQKPRKLVRHWIEYSGGAVGLALVSGWVVQHSRLGGSDDLDRWLKQAREDAICFLDERVKQPLLSIRGEIFDTFQKRHRGVGELGDVQLTADSLHRMVRAFVAKTKGDEVASKASDLELMEIMMSRYEEELSHPVQSLLGGELARALLIQVQKLKHDIETAMLELNQILRANEINFAILAALPALFFAVVLLLLLRKPFIEGKGAEGRGRLAQARRRMLMVEVEKAVMTCQMSSDEGREEDAILDYGLLIYCLDRLHKAVKKPAEKSGEWSSLRQDILDLAKPRMSTYYKLAIAARMERVYDCLAPMPK
ncbi:unnamed protein product [Sphagnum jensenii]|uniref:Protein DGS1, mitochondrial n=1 Tax=Sphagnum jensenii TaxID=128206 RepID=A0ABP1A9R0_9BRYO